MPRCARRSSTSCATLNRELGISIVYITHDLTTAYQICDNIVVLYRGTVAEAGSVERVIRDPEHPYTQLLVSSIPVPDRSQRWGGEELHDPRSVGGPRDTGCRFAPRCPYVVMEECWSNPPPHVMLDPDRLATCFLYKEHEAIPSEGIGQVFHRPQPAAVA